MAKRKENPKAVQEFTCSNSSCGLIFSKPLKVTNLNAESSGFYDACPRCLTAIEDETLPMIKGKPCETAENVKDQEITPDSEEGKTKRLPEVKCAHHFGYLSERSKNENIPDECVVCGNIVQCMLKTING